ncbi:proton-conducting transporter transmembrane domain-containing protein [Ancylomarina longa]|uniref:NADH-quinone oxidoreductase subunit E n=1 Tax=Ancylomarina longa TaxID=2487017 RepID=A0A434AZF3_9BACT|nr:proton-conducting transporter membrane subunit [Ancylomarina longa]RUT79827.1 NADH-quinone oxidoreductase subunit E [Ancylomarina longa]
MDILLLKFLLLFSLALFFVGKKHQHALAFGIQIVLIALTSYWAVNTWLSDTSEQTFSFLSIYGHPVNLRIDYLASFFILIVNFTMLTGMLYAKGYLKAYRERKNQVEFGLHYFSFLWLHISMILVCSIHDGYGFLMTWELMSLASFFLVIFESENKETIKAGINYLIQMHVGFAFLLVAFLYASASSNTGLGFDGLAAYFSNHAPFPLFLLFFIGFGIKAGFIPLHTWLPHAHPAAPSHVSGVMSGVMIKIGIYGILRVLTYIHTDLLPIGVFILFISLSSGILGVTIAIAQHDIKRLLAYHSIENIGIIGIGIGIGTIGLALHIPVLAVFGFAGGLLHILNHSLFKSLLFYAAGNVYQQTHTRNIEELGGLIKKMPKTAILFLLGSLAISGLPPFNGFISEFLIYFGMFKGLLLGDLQADILILAGFLSLVLIGGLAVFCFTKVFSIIFLGTPRSEKAKHAEEVSNSMLFPKLFIALLIVAIGFVPTLFIQPLNEVVKLFTGDLAIPISINPLFNKIAVVYILFVGLIIGLWLLRKWQQNKNNIQTGPTWGCAYEGADPAITQYTASSYADNLKEFSNLAMNIHAHKVEFEEAEIFPSEKEFASHSSDVFEDNLIKTPTNKLLVYLEKAAIFQTGKLQHYLLYALLFIFLIFLLTVFNVI